MGAKSKIEWTEATWNPVRGCSRVSVGCRNCYAERQAARNLPGLKSPTTGELFAIRRSDGPHWTGKVELIEHMIDIPLRTKNPTVWFVNSMSDLFHEALPDEAIDRVFAVMANCPQHTFQVLTKRAKRMLKYLSDLDRREQVEDAGGSIPGVCYANTQAWPLPNVWVGVSVEDQPAADERIPHLLRTPAALRFVSYEPALALADFHDFVPGRVNPHWSGRADDCPYSTWGIDWLIVGGESGPGARPFDIAWARIAIAQCKAAGVPCFMKQLGSRWAKRRNHDPDQWTQVDSKGGDMSEWPEDLRVREYPVTSPA